MKAIKITKYGSPDEVIKLVELEKPVPKDNEVLIRVNSCSLTYSNLMLILGKPYVARFAGMGLLKPKHKIPGSDISGKIIELGSDVSEYSIGDEVYVDTASNGRGGLAEFATAPASVISIKPSNISHEAASAVPEAALVALQALRDDGQIKAGMKVLIVGASGGIGSFAVQIAKYYDAEVTGVCGTGNIEMVKSLGADHVIDYTKEDFIDSGPYDLIISTAGFRPISDYKKALSPRGIYVCTGGEMKQIFQAMLLGPFLSQKSGKKLGSMLVKTNIDLDFMRELIESEKIKPLIDRVYSIEDTAEAFRYYASGHAKGKVIITLTVN